eukprot:CAMPEP_0119528362 /NCGR_PEP_ID=MMETSP1344-20130328/42577_1 /TAXON_ID=236787 /ORGANISM="Florenciella parvula, Strain CCMP2471" /LENGTH=73 /DNA_ID=CAMNT_0007567745 /DNA_START=130 /DNA_END=352 /DNA_ORIENTATION=+
MTHAAVPVVFVALAVDLSDVVARRLAVGLRRITVALRWITVALRRVTGALRLVTVVRGLVVALLLGLPSLLPE